MDFSSAEAGGLLAPLFDLAMAALFLGALVYLARLNQRLTTLRGAQSELHGLLRACSDNVDQAERAIADLRDAASGLSAELAASLAQAERLKTDIDDTCAAARRLLVRLGEQVPTAPAARDAVRENARATPDPQPGTAEPARALAPPPRRRPIARPVAERAEPQPAPARPAPAGGVEPRWTGRRPRPAPTPGEAMVGDGPQPMGTAAVGTTEPPAGPADGALSLLRQAFARVNR